MEDVTLTGIEFTVLYVLAFVGFRSICYSLAKLIKNYIYLK